MTEALTNNSETPIVSVRSLLEIRRTSPRYKDTPAETRQKWLLNKIAYCNALNHSRQEPDVLKVDTAALDEAMMRDPQVADLTAPEISFAMYHGTMGEYGEYYGLTPRTFLSFFREFLKTDVKFSATWEEKKQKEPERGTWVLQRMEHHRQEVQKEWEMTEARDEADAALEGWKKNLSQLLKNTQQ